MRRASSEREAAQQLVVRLRKRRAEIEQAALSRAKTVSPLPQVVGIEYAEGLRSAVAAAVEYGLEAIERGEDDAPSVPTELLAQARLAASHQVSIDIVMRRYIAGYALLEDFLVQESGLLPPEELKRLLRRLAALVDGLLAAVGNAYADEQERRAKKTPGRQRTERIERLLAGNSLTPRACAMTSTTITLASLP